MDLSQRRGECGSMCNERTECLLSIDSAAIICYEALMDKIFFSSKKPREEHTEEKNYGQIQPVH